MAQRILPPHDGSLTVVPGFVDFHAEHNADLPWATYPSRTDPGAVESITFAQFARATHRVAHIVRPNRQGSDGQVVTLLIHCDTILYLAAIAGLIRANIVPFPVSPRNSPEAVASLMEKTGSHRVLVSRGVAPIANAARGLLRVKGHDVEVDTLFSLFDVFPHLASGGTTTSPEFLPYPAYDKPYNPDDVAFILHSSGSTGLPKPIPKTRKIMLQWALADTVQTGAEMGIRYGGMGLPTFHTVGLFVQLYGPLSGAIPVCLYAPQEPAPPVVPTPENILETAKITGCDGIISVPSVIEAWAQHPENLKFLASLKVLVFAGGPLSTAGGNKLVEAGVHLHSAYGTTELGAPTKRSGIDESLPPDAPAKTKWDWEWLEMSDRVKPRWDPQGDGRYELQLLTCETHQPCIENLPDTKGYATSDLFIPHPTKKGLWKLVGRKDDVIVLGSGEKIVPTPQENHIISSPLAIGAVMFGWGKPQPGVLIQPSPAYAFDPTNEAELVKYRNLIWPVIEEANQLGPGFARMFKETIIVAGPTKPFPRAAKGTVLRKPTLALYQDEIEQLYQTLEDSSNAQGISPPSSWGSEDLQSWLVEHIRSLNGGKAPSPDTDIFTVGVDSLSATILRNRIVGALRSSEEPSAQSAAGRVSQNFIFEHPTVHELAEAVASLVDPSAAVSQKDPVEEIKAFIDKYTAGLAQHVARSSPAESPITVLLTGSTGNLGSHVVAALISDERVSKVYTFDRASTGASPQERLQSAFKDRGLPLSVLASSRFASLTGDLTEPRFGLDETSYRELQDSVTHVVHTAWKVNFNHKLGSFETQIAGARKLVDFCLEAKHLPKLLFTSSISVALGCGPDAGPVPEAPLPDPRVATASGYASSKYVVEQIIHRAAQLGLRGTALRVGQLCGSKTTGAWNTSDWVPILVKSSVALGCLPDIPGNVDWAPTDAVAGAVLDLVVSDESAPSVVNVVHPHPVPWSTILSGFQSALRSPVPLVPYREWLAKLEGAAREPTPAQLGAIPAIQLLSFFQNIGKEGNFGFRTDELCRLSPTMRSLEPLDESYARRWVEFWRAKDYIS